MNGNSSAASSPSNWTAEPSPWSSPNSWPMKSEMAWDTLKGNLSELDASCALGVDQVRQPVGDVRRLRVGRRHAEVGRHALEERANQFVIDQVRSPVLVDLARHAGALGALP